MLEIAGWIAICFVSGSIPWAVIIGNVVMHKDVRRIGDGNPGAANAWKSGGFGPGIISATMEVSKSLVPVYVATQYLGHPVGLVSQIGMAMVAFAPVVGHGWSPFLKFKGGKTLAASWGSWIAITNGMAFPVGCALLSFAHLLQRNHAITVTICLAGFLVIFMTINMQPYLALFWAGNFLIVVYKHRSEYLKGMLLRDWVRKFVGRATC